MEKIKQLKALLKDFNWKESLLFATDSYKHSHFEQYPAGTSKVYSYIEARKKDLTPLVFFGVSSFIKKHLLRKITASEVEAAKLFNEMHGVPFNYDGWMNIVNRYDGFIPVEIKAVEEGSVIANGNVLVTITNRCPDSAWIVGYIETALLRHVWYQSTVATYSAKCKISILSALKRCTNMSAEDAVSYADFALHDFGARGCSSGETAALGAAAHLLSFRGSDTIEAAMHLIDVYDMDEMPSFSVPASEHSTVTMYLKDGEIDAMKNMIAKFAGKYPIISFVSDSYDLFANINIVCTQLIDTIRESGTKYVIRPDSGDPAKTLLKVFKQIDDHGLMAVNDKGFKELPDYLGVLQGDGINLITINIICSELISAGYSIKGLVFGMGGALLQAHNRDDCSFAMKCSYAIVDEQERFVQKCPSTDTSKVSKTGMFKLISFKGMLHTVSSKNAYDYTGFSKERDLLKLFYPYVPNCGAYYTETSIPQVREKLRSYFISKY